MSNFNTLIKQEYKSAYENAYDLSLKKPFSTPKIYTANNNLNKRWYVYFSFRNPETGKLKRQTPIYGNANSYKTKEERMAVLSIYQQALLKLLRQGFSPYENNTQRYHELQSKKNEIKPLDTAIENATDIATFANNNIISNHNNSNNIATDNANSAINSNSFATKHNNSATIQTAFTTDEKVKEQTLRASSLRSYKSHIKIFKNWITTNNPQIKYITEIDKTIVVSFLNEILTSTSARNRNNYKASISSLFTTFEDNDLIKNNFVKNIKKLNTSPTRNKSFSKDQVAEIFTYLEQEDQLLLLFIKFVSYNLLRPIEVCRLQIQNIDIKQRTLSFKAKNSPLKTKIIPEILWKELPDLSQLKPEDYLFTPNGIGYEWNQTADSKRNYFSKRFKKTVKDKFNLSEEYGLYSFRHTYITKLYRSLVKNASPFEAKSKLMQITGHSSMQALESYLREIDAALPNDYSTHFDGI